MFFRKNKLQKSNIKNILKIVMMQEISSSRTLSPITLLQSKTCNMRWERMSEWQTDRQTDRQTNKQTDNAIYIVDLSGLLCLVSMLSWSFIP